MGRSVPRRSSSFVEIELIEFAVDRGVTVRPPRSEFSYVGFVDSATGVGTVSFAAAVAHKEGELIVCDVVYEKRPPFSAEAAFAEVAALFKAYGIDRCVGDKFGAGLTIEAAARYGLTYEYSELDRSQLYISTLPLFSSGRVRLVDNKRLVAQFASLERRTSAIGRDVVNHPNNRNDDAANACAGALTLAAAPATTSWTSLCARGIRRGHRITRKQRKRDDGVTRNWYDSSRPHDGVRSRQKEHDDGERSGSRVGSR